MARPKIKARVRAKPRDEARADGLMMDYASRMKRAGEQGFDTSRRWYHGTNQDLNRFGLEFSGDVTHHPSTRGDGTVWLTASPEHASEYADLAAANTRRNKTYLDEMTPIWQRQIDEAARKGDWKTQERITELWEDAELGEASRGGENVLPLLASPQKVKTIDFHDVSNFTEDVRKARDDGFDAVVFKNSMDAPKSGGTIAPADHMVVFDPANIRSTNAAFDPANSGKADLLGAATPSRLAATALAGAAGVAGVRALQQERDPWAEITAHHERELAAGGKRNDDGSLSTVRTIGVGIDGREYVIPTIWDGREVSRQEAIQRAKQRGLEHYPSYATPEEGEAANREWRKRMRLDQAQADRDQWGRGITARRDARIQREDLARQRQQARADRLRAIDTAISDALRRPTYHTPEGEQIPPEVAQMRRARGEPVIEQSSALGDVIDFVRPSPAAAAAWIEPMTGQNSAAAERAMSVLDVPGVLMGFAVDQILEGME